MHRWVQAWGRLGRGKGLWSGRITDALHAVNVSTSFFSTLANQAGVVFPIFGFLANCTVRNILCYSRSNTKRERGIEKCTNIGHSCYAFFSFAESWKTRYYQNLKGPDCFSSSLGRLENESEEGCRWSFSCSCFQFLYWIYVTFQWDQVCLYLFP